VVRNIGFLLMWILKSIVSYIPSINIVALTFVTSHSHCCIRRPLLK
jgi:uncharacterized membrane protein